MSQQYQLQIFQQGKLLGQFNSSLLHPLDAIRCIKAQLQQDPTLEFQLFKMVEHARYLRLQDGEMKVMGIEHTYQPCDLAILDNVHGYTAFDANIDASDDSNADLTTDPIADQSLGMIKQPTQQVSAQYKDISS